ncbi:hypothetical protein RHDE110596_17310 [Prescottella defluvii]
MRSSLRAPHGGDIPDVPITRGASPRRRTASEQCSMRAMTEAVNDRPQAGMGGDGRGWRQRSTLARRHPQRAPRTVRSRASARARTEGTAYPPSEVVERSRAVAGTPGTPPQWPHRLRARIFAEEPHRGAGCTARRRTPPSARPDSTYRRAQRRAGGGRLQVADPTNRSISRRRLPRRVTGAEAHGDSRRRPGPRPHADQGRDHLASRPFAMWVTWISLEPA